jgi:isopentenyl diphosphate isomerase/L-lactate dehydrogenase-like FMN-dependent dehydrogenase
MADRCMLAGNVSLFGIDPQNKRVGKICLRNSAIVANTCVLQAGTVLSESTLLGDLSATDHAHAGAPNTVSVGSPPRVVGRTDFRKDSVSSSRYVLNQICLVLMQWTSLATSNVVGFLVLGACFIALLPIASTWIVWVLMPGLLLLQRLVRVTLLPVFKWLMVGRIAEREHAAYGWYFVRWILVETLLMDAEPLLAQLQGTQFLNLLWRSLGARVGSNAIILSSSLGCEFDLKDIGSDVVLHQQSLVFAHSIEHHSLLFKATKIEDGSEIGSFSIAEAGAVVAAGQVEQAHTAIHAKQTRISRTEKPDLLNVHDFERAAERKLSKAAFDYFAGGAEDNISLQRNRSVFSWLRICPRVLVDVSNVSTRCTVLQHTLASPIMIAPTAMQKLAHSDGECAVARSASRLNMAMVLSMLSTTELEEVAAVFRGASGLPLLQLYLLKDRASTEDLIQRAEASGFKGLVITVDAPVSGRREADIRNRFTFADDVTLPHLGGRGSVNGGRLQQFEMLKNQQLTWDSLAWFRQHTRLPIWLKGVMHEQDVLRACSLGYDGIILSNHGGRQLDVAPSALEVVQPIRQAIDRAGYKVSLIVDGGIRRGSDVFKALALGADLVLVGRPVIFGLAANGQPGVTDVLKILNDELALTMRLAGCPTLGSISPDWLHADREFYSTQLRSGLLSRPGDRLGPAMH